MTKTLHSQCRGPGFNHWLGSKIPCDTTKSWYSQINLKKQMLKKRISERKDKPVSLKGNQPLIFTGRTDAEVEAPIL